MEMRIYSWGAHRIAGFFPGRRRNAANFPGEDLRPLVGRASGLSPPSPPAGKPGSFRATARVVFHGFVFYRECSVLEAILIATDVF